MTTEFRKIGVLGAGQMGCGIAQVAAASGLDVVLVDRNEGNCLRGVATVTKGVQRLVQRGKLTDEESAALLGRISHSLHYAAFEDANVVIEAVSERKELKLQCLAQIEAAVDARTLIASNTSSLSITLLAGSLTYPDRMIGMHFMNPVPVMQLVEVIRGLQTSDETVAATEALAARMGKTTVLAQDYPGFIVNRVLIPMINEACYALMEQVGTVEDIDQAMKLGTNQPMGPLTLADFIGLDTCLAIMEVLQDGFGDAKYRPCPLLRKYVQAGWLGRKTGRGFYTYTKE
jgi:3-hydroxybutyryl-CoA dehydrogenase